MLFYIDTNNALLLHEDALKLCPELAKLNSKERLYVVLFRDYFSPYHQFPDNIREQKARRHVYGEKDVKLSHKKILDAINAYDSLQYDERREMIDMYAKKIQILKKEFLDTESATRIATIDKTLESLIDRQLEIQKEIDTDTRMDKLRGGGTISLLEVWKRNRKEHAKSGL